MDTSNCRFEERAAAVKLNSFAHASTQLNSHHKFGQWKASIYSVYLFKRNYFSNDWFIPWIGVLIMATFFLVVTQYCFKCECVIFVFSILLQSASKVHYKNEIEGKSLNSNCTAACECRIQTYFINISMTRRKGKPSCGVLNPVSYLSAWLSKSMLLLERHAF